MGFFTELGPLSYIGAALIIFFIASFFIKKQNLLTKPQVVQYQSLKLEVTLNILVFLAGLIFLYLDYTNNYQKLNSRYSGETTGYRDSLQMMRNSFKMLNEEYSKKEKINFEFLIRLTSVSGSYPLVSDLECSYKETSRAPLKRAEIENSDYGGSDGTYKVMIYDIGRFSTVPYIEVRDKKNNKWTSEENLDIRPPVVDLILKN